VSGAEVEPLAEVGARPNAVEGFLRANEAAGRRC
jgi:hypothetical protein